MAVEAEQLLHADRELGPLFGLVVDRHTRARRRAEMGGRLGVEPAAQASRATSRAERSASSSLCSELRARSCRQAPAQPIRCARAPARHRTGPAIRRPRLGAETSTRSRHCCRASSTAAGRRRAERRHRPGCAQSPRRAPPASAARPARSRRAGAAGVRADSRSLDRT